MPGLRDSSLWHADEVELDKTYSLKDIKFQRRIMLDLDVSEFMSKVIRPIPLSYRVEFDVSDPFYSKPPHGLRARLRWIRDVIVWPYSREAKMKNFLESMSLELYPWQQRVMADFLSE